MKKANLHSITVTPEGHLEVKMAKSVDVDGENILLGWHRTVVEVGGDSDAQMAAVNSHLMEMGFSAVPEQELIDVKAHAAIAAKPEKVKAFRDLMAAASIDKNVKNA